MSKTKPTASTSLSSSERSEQRRKTWAMMGFDGQGNCIASNGKDVDRPYPHTPEIGLSNLRALMQLLAMFYPEIANEERMQRNVVKKGFNRADK